MTNQWNVTVRGRERQVSIEHTETGKDVIRVDGRTAARPLSLDEAERAFDIDGFAYTVRRDGENFTLDQVVDPLAPRPEAFGYADPRMQPAPLPDVKLAKLTQYWWVGVVAAVAVLMYFALPSYTKDASKRVETMLLDLKEGPNAESSIATTIWARNVRSMDSGELSAANDQFMKWRSEKNFDLPRGFASHRMVKSEKTDGEVPTAIVTFELDGKTYRVRVPERRPISWAD